MSRTPFWAAIALFPLVVALSPSADAVDVFLASRLDTTSPIAQILLLYWWVPVVAAAIASLVYFVQHAARNGALSGWRRVSWVSALILLGPLVAPPYWWLHSASRTTREA